MAFLSDFENNGVTLTDDGSRKHYTLSEKLTITQDLTINGLTEFLSGSTPMIQVENGAVLTINTIASETGADVITYGDNVVIETSYKNDTAVGTYSPTHAITLLYELDLEEH